MKSTIRFTFFGGFVLALAVGALAAPRSKQAAPSRAGSSGERQAVAYTCNECASAGSGAAMTCKRGDNLVCDSCVATTKVAARGRPASKVAGRESVIVNNKGEVCRFYAMAAPTK